MNFVHWTPSFLWRKPVLQLFASTTSKFISASLSTCLLFGVSLEVVADFFVN